MTPTILESILARVTKPGQYLGNEVNVVKKSWDEASVRVCLVFPDKYEMGMSHVGLKILYKILNDLPGVVCERAYAPEPDMEAELRAQHFPLFSLESKHSLADFDMIGFSFTYELTYTNFLNILDLSGIPLWQKDRTNSHPLILGGGGSMMNAEPLADFLDAAVLGDGEEVVLEIVEAVRNWKLGIPPPLKGGGEGAGDHEVTLFPTLPPQGGGGLRANLLVRLSTIEGIYIPSLFQPVYNNDGTLREVKPLKEGYTRINKRVVKNLDKAPYPTDLLVPSVKLIHDRIGIEIQRGCNRACRFCQAGYIDRPVRQRSPETVLNIAEESLKKTGIEDISLLSLSAADYAPIVPLMAELNRRYADKKIAISVPATRTEKLTPALIEQIKRVRKTGFTVAPEAGSPRMRRVINKGNAVDDLFRAVTNAFSAGWNLLKLYYMVGLPFERDEDVLGIADEANKSIEICFQYSGRSELNLSVSSFVPKPHTPFQWEPQMTTDETRRRHDLVKRGLNSRRIRFKHHNPRMSFLEGLLSRGDRRVAKILYLAFQKGCRFDEWEEHFRFELWEEAIVQSGLDASFYLHRRRSFNEILPWDHLFAQMDKGWLWDEYQKAREVGLEGLSEEQKAQFDYCAEHHEHRRLNPVSEQLAGFTEDCSVARCSYCGVCDFKEIKNRIYVVGDKEIMAKKGNREWYGWGQKGDRREETGEERKRVKEGIEEGLGQGLNIRFRFSKTGLARFMGHLELMGVLKRAIKRMQIPVLYSEGFHPQMKLAMSHALSVGIESEWEFFDLELTQSLNPQELMEKINQALPEGLRILSTEVIDRGSPSLYSRVNSFLFEASGFSTPHDGALAKKLDVFLNSESFIWERKDKERVKSFNLKEMVHVDPSAYPQKLLFETRVTETGSLRPSEVIEALLGLSKSNLFRLRKAGFTLKNGEKFGFPL